MNRWWTNNKEAFGSQSSASSPLEVRDNRRTPVPVLNEQGVVVLPTARPYERIPQQKIGVIGVQVDAWGALVMNKGDLAQSNAVLYGTMDALARREVVNLAFDVGGLQIGDHVTNRPHVFIYQKLPETSSEAVVVLRVADRGPDLEISWRLNENNPKRANNYKKWGNRFVSWGIVWLVVGLALLIVGIGALIELVAVPMIGFGLLLQRIPQRQTLVSLYDQFDSRALAVTVHYCLMQALGALGVDQDDLLLLREYDKQGLAKLGEFKLEWSPS